MPRPERPLDTEDSALLRFAGDLRRLREKAGSPPYRELGKRAHYSAATLSEAAGGRKVPTLAVTRAFVRACGGDEAAWEQRWRELTVEESPPDCAAPYAGLAAFQPEDADRFFGRERLTDQLLGLVRERRFVGVFGASGSGKSSLLRAGLVPQLERPVLVLTPGAHPLEECAVRLAGLVGESAVMLKNELELDPAHLHLRIRQWNDDLVLVVDQFEEIFTLGSAEEREWFVQAITSGPHVVIGVRADFYGHCGRHPELVDALLGSQLLVGPMTPDELRRAITEPAARAGAAVETALVARLIADVAGQAAALPLVSHALVETWRRRRGMMLSLAGYEEAGALEHAVARTAEEVYNSFTPGEQRVARQLFLRLIALGEGTEDTKRRVPRRELDVDEMLLERLAHNRLITLDRSAVELTHEALIRSWPRLRDWIAADREVLRVHRKLIDATDAWESDDRDPDALYRGVRLAQAKELRDSLTGRERDFLDESVAADNARQAAERARTRQLRRLVSLLTVLVVVLGIMVFYTAAAQRSAARQRTEALSVRAAVEAMAHLDGDVTAAVRFALAGYALAPTSEATDALLSVNTATKRNVSVSSDADTLWPILVSPRGDLVLVPDAKGHHELVHFTQFHASALGSIGRTLRHAVFSAHQRLVITYAKDSPDAEIWRIGPGLSKVAELPSMDVLELTTDGRYALAVKDLAWSLVDLMDPERPRVVPLPLERGSSARVSPDGRVLASIRAGEVALWRILDTGEVRPSGRFSVPKHSELLGCSADGRMLAIVDKQARTVDVHRIDNPASPVRWTTIKAAPARGDFAFSDDSRAFATREGAVLRVWSLEAQDRPHRIASISPRGDFFHVTYNTQAREFWAFGVVTDPVEDRNMVRVNRFDHNVHRVRSSLCELSSVELTAAERASLFGETGLVNACP